MVRENNGAGFVLRLNSAEAPRLPPLSLSLSPRLCPPSHTMAGYGFDIDVIDTLLKPSVITHPYISLLLSLSPPKLPPALPQEQLGVSECGWSGGRAGREGRGGEGERERERELAQLSCFPKREGRGGRDTRKRELGESE